MKRCKHWLGLVSGCLLLMSCNKPVHVDDLRGHWICQEAMEQVYQRRGLDQLMRYPAIEFMLLSGAKPHLRLVIGADTGLHPLDSTDGGYAFQQHQLRRADSEHLLLVAGEKQYHFRRIDTLAYGHLSPRTGQAYFPLELNRLLLGDHYYAIEGNRVGSIPMQLHLGGDLSNGGPYTRYQLIAKAPFNQIQLIDSFGQKTQVGLSYQADTMFWAFADRRQKFLVRRF